jgi:hypothetical protein
MFSACPLEKSFPGNVSQKSEKCKQCEPVFSPKSLLVR